jgi:hypothetical protein
LKTLKSIFNFYIFSNIHVAFATFCLTKITLLEIGITENKTAWFVFFSTLVSYNIIRFIRLGDVKNWFGNWFQENEKYLYVITGIGMLFLIYFTFQLRFKALLVLIPFAFFTVFYVIPIKKKALRNVAGLKLILIAISWAGITVLFPIVQNYILPRTTDYITFLQRFLFVVVITIPFDIRDLNYDKIELKTLPQKVGIQKSKLLGLLFLVLFFFLEFFKNEINTTSSVTLLLVMVISGTLLLKSSDKKNKYYSAFFVEALPIIWFFLVLINKT